MTAVLRSMKAVIASEPGGPEVLKLSQFPMPALQKGEVLIKVAAAGLNRADVMQRDGHYNPPDGVTDILGLEVAGEIVAMRDASGRFNVGDKVCALLAGGGYAAYAAVPEGQCLPWPKHLSAIEAACLPEATFTVWANLFEDGELKAGETVLLHGAASGIGTTAIQMIRAAGAHVIGTVSSDTKAKKCLELGADFMINNKAMRFKSAVLEHTNGRGVDVVLDMMGGGFIESNLECLAMFGRHISISAIKNPKGRLHIGTVMAKRLKLTGSTLRARSVEEKTRLRDAVEKHVWPWVMDGSLKPFVFQTFPLELAGDAHKVMDSGEVIGKIALTLDA